MTEERAAEIRKQLAEWAARPAFVPEDLPALCGILGEMLETQEAQRRELEALRRTRRRL